MKDKNTILSKGEIVSDTYEVQFFIGQGAFGEVYRVKHKYLGLQVLKVFKEKYAEETNLETITNEAKILSKLTHPNIVRVFEANSFTKRGKQYYFITMGFVSGETLHQLISREIYLPFEQTMSIQMDFLSGLKAAHIQNPPIIHRDISPDNILLSYETDTPQAMLSDFGLSLSIDKLSRIAGAAGKTIYFAPECFWDVYLPASDVFSAGIVFYIMLTGVHPWEYAFENIPDDFEQISTMIIKSRTKTPKKPSVCNEKCDGELDEIVLKALSKDLEYRYQNADEFLSALKGVKVNTSPKNSYIPKVPSETNKYGFKVKKKGKGFDDIAGMTELKETLYHDIIQPLSDAKLYEKYKVSPPNGMLLYGPPGCGKTFISQKFAEEVDYNFIEIKPSNLASIYVHGTQEKIGQLFQEAKEKAPTIIFIDEIDAILPNREGSLSHSYASEVNEFLAQMTECNKNGIFIIAATNRPERIDPAILRTGRIDRVIYLGPLDFNARLEMFKMYLEGRPVDPDINLKNISEMTENYVPSDISYIVNEASRNALKDRTNINQQHIEDVIRQTQPSVSMSQIKKYEEFKNNRSFV